MDWLIILAFVAQIADATASCRAAHNHAAKYALSPKQICATTITGKATQLSVLPLMGGKTKKVYASALIVSGAVGFTVTVTLK